MPLIQTRGAASAQGFGEFAQAASAVNYIEDVFSTYLYTGTNALNTITNGIDLSTKGGLVWFKNRSARTGAYAGYDRHITFDNIRTGATSGGAGGGGVLRTNAAALDDATVTYLSSYNNNGVTIASNATVSNAEFINQSGTTFALWTFRKQPKFFDVVTYTGDGVDDRQIAHSLGSTPGCVMIKRTDTTGDWAVSHNYDFGNVLFLNTTAAAIANPASNGYFGYPANPLQSTYFTLGTNAATNASGGTYVAYIFAHDAGGFGLTGTDNVISCGSYTGVGGGNVATITLGYEPQWILVKRTDNSIGGNWGIFDNMRGMSVNATNNAAMLNPNLSDAESVLSAFTPTATGFQTGANFTASGGTYIYIAIRRGPMKVPTTGTSVFNTVFRNATAGLPQWNSGFVTDFSIVMDRDGSGNIDTVDRLRGTKRLLTYSDAAESNGSPNTLWDYMNGFGATSGSLYDRQLAYMYRRAPSVFDVVCYTGNDAYNRAVNHNLTVVPEMIIVKARNRVDNWPTYVNSIGTGKSIYLNGSGAPSSDGSFPTTPTSSVFYLGAGYQDNGSTFNYVAYLFATCAGVSKVGSYTGTGATQTINCGFGASGARFVLIKRTDSTGDWYVWDSARGMISGTDPSLLLNSTAAEVNANSVYAISTGFQIVSTAAGINASGGSYIFLSVA